MRRYARLRAPRARRRVRCAACWRKSRDGGPRAPASFVANEDGSPGARSLRGRGQCVFDTHVSDTQARDDTTHMCPTHRPGMTSLPETTSPRPRTLVLLPGEHGFSNPFDLALIFARSLAHFHFHERREQMASSSPHNRRRKNASSTTDDSSTTGAGFPTRILARKTEAQKG